MKKLINLLFLAQASFSFSQNVPISEYFGYTLSLSIPTCVEKIDGVYYLDTTCNELNNLEYYGCTTCSFKSKELTYLKNLKCLALSGSTMKNLSDKLFVPLSLTKLIIDDCTFSSIAYPAGLDSLIINRSSFNYGTVPNELTYLEFSGAESPDSLLNIPDSLEKFEYVFNIFKDTKVYDFPSFSNAKKLKSLRIVAIADSRFNYNKILSEVHENLQILTLSAHNLDSIDNLPLGLQVLDVSDTNLVYISAFPPNLKFLSVFGAISCLPIYPSTLEYISVISTVKFCHPNVIPGVISVQNICAMPEAKPNNCSGLSLIHLNTYSDIEGNCSYDNTIDLGLYNLPVKLYDSSMVFLRYGQTDKNGDLGFSVEKGNYFIELDTANTSLRLACPGAYKRQVKLDGIDTYGYVEMGLTCDSSKIKNGDKYDLEAVNITFSNSIRPNGLFKVCTNIKDALFNENLLCELQFPSTNQPTVLLKVIGPVKFVGDATKLNVNISGDSTILSWKDTLHTSNLDIKDCLLFQADSSAIEGESVCAILEILTDDSDTDHSNNSTMNCTEVLNSYDPNKKDTWPMKVEPGFKEEIRYTIHFQNTGNAEAINVLLVDTLDQQLDLNTFKIIEASHDVQPILEGTRLLFKFNNINLADSMSDPAGSQGHVTYSIFPKAAMELNDEILNTAHIFFDFNEAIVTNTSVNLCTLDTGVGLSALEQGNDPFIVYPNPIKGQSGVYIKHLPKEKTAVELYALSGKKLGQYSLSHETNFIDFSDLQTGIYLLQIEVNDSMITKKVIKL